MTTLYFLYLVAEITVTLAAAWVSSVSTKETNAFVPHLYAQAAHSTSQKSIQEKKSRIF